MIINCNVNNPNPADEGPIQNTSTTEESNIFDVSKFIRNDQVKLKAAHKKWLYRHTQSDGISRAGGSRHEYSGHIVVTLIETITGTNESKYIFEIVDSGSGSLYELGNPMVITTEKRAALCTLTVTPAGFSARVDKAFEYPLAYGNRGGYNSSVPIGALLLMPTFATVPPPSGWTIDSVMLNSSPGLRFYLGNDIFPMGEGVWYTYVYMQNFGLLAYYYSSIEENERITVKVDLIAVDDQTVDARALIATPPFFQ
jgi:hypothetical protein